MESATQSTLRLSLKRLYIKEISCKVPHAPSFFAELDAAKEPWQPVISFEVHTKHQPLSNNQHEITVHVSVAAKTKENVTAFTIDMQQAGIFIIEGLSQEQLNQALKFQCPSLLFPHVCRAIYDATIQAGFPPLLLTPFGFEQNKQPSAVNKEESVKL